MKGNLLVLGLSTVFLFVSLEALAQRGVDYRHSRYRLAEVGPAAVGAGRRSGFLLLPSPALIQDARFIEAELGHGDPWVVRFNMRNDVGLRGVLIWRGQLLVDRWCHESVRSLRNRRLTRGDHHRGSNFCTNSLGMNVRSGAWQFLFSIKVILVVAIDTATMLLQILAHRVESALLAKSGIFFI